MAEKLASLRKKGGKELDLQHPDYVYQGTISAGATIHITTTKKPRYILFTGFFNGGNWVSGFTHVYDVKTGINHRWGYYPTAYFDEDYTNNISNVSATGFDFTSIYNAGDTYNSILVFY